MTYVLARGGLVPTRSSQTESREQFATGEGWDGTADMSRI